MVDLRLFGRSGAPPLRGSRSLKGSVTEVRKPFSSASDVAVNHDVLVWSSGGAIMPKRGPIAMGLNKAYWKLIKKHSNSDVHETRR